MAKTPVQLTYELFIGAPAAKVWRGLVDAEMTAKYVYGTRLETKLEKGAPYAYVGEGGFKVVEGEILEVDPAKRLAMTWRANYDEAAAKDRPSRVTYELAPAGDAVTKLRVVHDFDGETATYKGSAGGWAVILSGLKTLLETGKPLALPSQ